MINLADEAMTIKLDYDLPEYPKMESCYRRAPRRESHLTEADKALAIKNALRYIHPDHHEQMAKEFAAGARGAWPHLRLPLPSRGQALRQAHRRVQRASASRAAPFRS